MTEDPAAPRPPHPCPAPPLVDVASLAAARGDFVATVAGAYDPCDVLARLVRGVVAALAVDGAGVMLADEGSPLLRLAHSDGSPAGPVRRAGELQELLQEGPCRDSHRTGQVVDVDDLAVVADWPEYRRRVADLGIHGVTAIPLRARGRGWGVLDLYRTEARRFGAAEMAAAHALAELATSYLVISADRQAAESARDELHHRATHDRLTGLPVREVLLDRLAGALAGLDDGGGHVGVLFLDLDGLKYVNDTFGHAAGDHLVRTCAARARDALRPGDLLARVGGDELVVLLADLRDAHDAGDVAHRVLARLTAPLALDGRDLAPSASIGVAVTDDPATTPESLVAHADSAMHRAKRAGRGRVDVFDARVYEAGRARAVTADHLVPALRAALDDGDLRLHYQPVLDVVGRPGREVVVAVEALLRWQRPGHGLLAAGEFLEEVECTGLMTELGAWVLRTACAQVVAWDAELGPCSPDRVLVNVSGLELTDPGLPRRVRETLEETGLAPSRLVLEVTETALVTDEGTALATVDALLATGCGLAVDDFGTGWSSLRRLVDLPVTTLKVDRSFTRDVLGSADAAAVVAAVLRLGRDLGRTVVVEGVEDAATQRALVDLGATHLQGFHLGRPASAEDTAARLSAAAVPAPEVAP